MGGYALATAVGVDAVQSGFSSQKSKGTVSEAGKSQTGTAWDDITSTADDIPYTKIPATYETKLNSSINYTNPENGSNSVWINANATKHMGEYISRLGGETASSGVRSQIMLESYNASLNKAMLEISSKNPGRHFGIFGNWELGINTETGVVYHARMIK